MTGPDPAADLASAGSVLIAAFEGWNDAGDAASGAVEHLSLAWDATEIAEISSDDYYDFQVNRPTISQIDGIPRGITWPTTSLARCEVAGRQIILLRGIEPNMRWRSFCDEIVDLVHDLDVDTVVILGALLADTPHTRPVPVTGAAFSEESAARLGLARSTYEGPTGIAGVLHDACVRAGVPAVSLWAAVPHYVAQPPNPKATAALLAKLEDVIDIEVPLAELPAQAEDWEREVSAMTADDDEIAEYVRSLEERGDEALRSDAATKIDGDMLAAEFERYLRRRGPGGFGR